MGNPKHDHWKPKSIHSIAELREALDAIERAHAAGTLNATGNWSAGQILEHCGILIRESLDGFTLKVPFPMKLIGSVVLKPIATKPTSQFKPGIKAPKSASALMPTDGASFAVGFGLIDQQVKRLEDGAQMVQPSPLFGKMTHQRWVNLHLNHCRMHFGFLEYAD